MPAKIDIVGIVFSNNLLVIEDLGRGKVVCKCLNCGSIKEYYKKNVKDGSVKSCGCLSKEHRHLEINQKYGHWKVLEILGDKALCQCDCENKTERILYKKALLDGRTKSCGCARNENKSTKETKPSRSKYIGKTINRLTIKDFKDGKFLCDCACGTKDFIVYASHVINGTTKSCGCLRQEMKLDLLDKEFGFWKVIGACEDNRKVLCRCICGTEKYIYKSTLLRNMTKSCGCKSIELTSKTMLDKYGDTCTLKIGNPRDKLQIEVLESRETFKEFLNSFDEKPTACKVSQLLNINESSIWRYVHKYKLEEHIEIYRGSSKIEDEVYKFISSITNKQIERHVRGLFEINTQYELDFYIRSKNIAIEVNGDYWHCSEYKNQNYHQIKTLECEKLGIHLVHIFESEWINNKEKVQMLLYNLLSDDKIIIYARKCKIDTEIKLNELRDFENKFHFQGYVPSENAIGIRYNSQLIAVMTFGKPRFDTEYDVELLRLCYDYQYIVIGGTEKLFNYYMNNYMHNNESMISYCDISKFNGNVYKRLGFSELGVTVPSYYWVNNKYDVLSRYKTQKKKLIADGFGNLGNTEDEIMRERGYHKVYTSGNKKFVYVKGVN